MIDPYTPPKTQEIDDEKDPKQFTNLSKNPEYQQIVKQFKTQLKEKLQEVRDNDIERSLTPKPTR